MNEGMWLSVRICLYRHIKGALNHLFGAEYFLKPLITYFAVGATRLNPAFVEINKRKFSPFLPAPTQRTDVSSPSLSSFYC